LKVRARVCFILTGGKLGLGLTLYSHVNRGLALYSLVES
jgi:hypothetical protein